MNEPFEPDPLPNPDQPPERLPPDDFAEEPPPGEELLAVLPVRKKGWPWLAWPVIIGMVAIVFLGTAHQKQEEAKAPPPQEKELEDIAFRLQAHAVVGQLDVMREMNMPLTDEDRKRLLEQVDTLNTGSVKQRLQVVIVAGEVGGPKAALKRLDDLKRTLASQKDALKPTRAQLTALGLLQRLYGDYARLQYTAPSVSKQDRQLLVDQLGWFGELALAPQGVNVSPQRLLPAVGAAGAASLADAWTPDSARREEVLAQARETFFGVGAAVLGVGALGLVGFVGLILVLTLALLGKLRGGLQCGSAHGGVYAETFALWLLMFVGLSLASQKLLPDADILRNVLAMFLSLLVLAWPVLRGIPWATVRQDIGWTTGRQPALEPAVGVACYIMGLPMLFVGVLVVLVLVAVEHALAEASGGAAGDQGNAIHQASHPIFGVLIHAGWLERLQIFLLASVAAPIVEETMFRGVLYRHLREGTCRTPYLFSVLFSATVVNFIFAAIHPQGWLGIPLLMALAYSFTLAREWRGSLIPSMIGHGLNNGLVMLLTMLVLGD